MLSAIATIELAALVIVPGTARCNRSEKKDQFCPCDRNADKLLPMGTGGLARNTAVGLAENVCIRVGCHKRISATGDFTAFTHILDGYW